MFPASTVCPTFAYILLQCAYQVSTPFPWSTFTKFPYDPLYDANVTVPDDTTFIFVPVGQAISSPVWVDFLLELDSPYLEEIFPLTGSTEILIPLTMANDSFSSFISWAAVFILFDATSNESVLISSVFTVYFSFILISISNSSVLNCSFIWLTIFSASSKVFTYSFGWSFKDTS